MMVEFDAIVRFAKDGMQVGRVNSKQLWDLRGKKVHITAVEITEPSVDVVGVTR